MYADWRDKLNKLLDGETKLFEESYIITHPCRYKINGRWVTAKIDIENKIIYDMQKNVLRRCN